MFIAATGWHNVAAWYDTISNSAMFMFITMMFCLFPLFTLVWWQLFVAAVSPYPLLVAVVLSVLFYITMFYLHFYSHTVGLALEMYHLPNWFRAYLRFSNPMLIRALRSSALQPKARQRAAELRVLAARFYSLDDGVLDVERNASKPVGPPAMDMTLMRGNQSGMFVLDAKRAVVFFSGASTEEDVRNDVGNGSC